MKQKRMNPADITPAYEDAGLFANGTCDVVVHLIPIIRRNGRRDIIVTGMVGENREVSVNFAGRRKEAATPIVAHLETIRNQTRYRAAERGLAAPPLNEMRVPVRVEGTWRKHVTADADGWETRQYELMAARWSIADNSGASYQYGEPPAHKTASA